MTLCPFQRGGLVGRDCDQKLCELWIAAKSLCTFSVIGEGVDSLFGILRLATEIVMNKSEIDANV